MVTTIPTIGFNVEQVTYKNLKFQVRELDQLFIALLFSFLLSNFIFFFRQYKLFQLGMQLSLVLKVFWCPWFRFR